VNIQIIDLVKRFDSGEIRLPLMQRDYVWRPAKVVKLLDSIYKRWPIGCFYVWHTKHDRPAKTRQGGQQVTLRSMDNFYGFLLDGQQRLTSLSLAIEGPAEHNLSTRAFFDVENEQFFLGMMKKTVQRRIEANDPTLVPLSDLISNMEIDETHLHQNIERIIDRLLERRKLGRSSSKAVEFRLRLHRLAGMLNEEALCEEFKDEHEENAIELFARLNKGGTSLSAGDVEAARLSQEATYHIVGPMREFVQEPELRRLGLNFVFATRALVTIHRGNSSFSNLPKSWASDASDVKDSWHRTERGLRIACNLVREELGWNTRRWLPSVNAPLWSRIKHKTRYAVDYNTSDLIDLVTKNLAARDKIVPPKISIQKSGIQITDQGLDTQLVAVREAESKDCQTSKVPDLLSYLQAKTELTRKTLSEILIKSGRLSEVRHNPQQFLEQAQHAIETELRNLMIDGIKYERINGYEYEMLLFEEREIAGALTSMIDVDNSIYDAVLFESKVEREFAEAMSTREDIKLFIKLPGWFKIDTPMGTYNPDWAIVKEEDEKLYLVRETKSTKEQLKLRGYEWAKVQCGRSHFDALNVDFDHVTSASEV
jgi:hypothetical protein